ncbi:MAG: ribonuclease Y [Ruminococcaceae bacterium]|nr:ribonuclease Y [Oscillospiraceae bacterium]
MEWIFLAVGVAIGVLASLAVVLIHRASNKKKLAYAQQEAKRILSEAVQTAAATKKEAILETKEAVLAMKNEAEEELKERRKEVTRQERRIAQKEEALDSKTEALEQKHAALQKKHEEAEALKAQISETLAKQLESLEKYSGLTAEEAKDELLRRVEGEIEHETALRIAEFDARFRDESSDRARDILSQAIQRCAADHVSEVAISVVPLPSEEMKGRIIGREGRNIRTIEQLIGVELIIDDTPEVITISGFDPIRRETARIALERLISDGRIHPARIEEMVEKARKEVDTAIKQAGEKAIFETGVHGLGPDLIRLLGRLKYRTSYGQNVLRHSIEVSLLSGMIADEIGVDSTVAKRAGLLHDIGKALTQEAEGSHIQLGVEVAKKYRESRDVIHAIEAHHGDVEPKTPLAFIIQAADAISAARPGARREDVENYIKRLQKLEEIAGEFEGVEKTFAIQAGREVRIMVKPEIISDDKMQILARDIAKKIEAEMEYPGQIKVNIIRESRVSDYAK